jgi:hypothetical protein
MEGVKILVGKSARKRPFKKNPDIEDNIEMYFKGNGKF